MYPDGIGGGSANHACGKHEYTGARALSGDKNMSLARAQQAADTHRRNAVAARGVEQHDESCRQGIPLDLGQCLPHSIQGLTRN